MAPTVRDFMSRQLVYLREGDRVEIAKHPILDFGISAVPVLDDGHKPVGMVSLRDLADDRELGGGRVRSPAISIAANATLLVAAHVLAEANIHHLVVVDSEDKAVGMISALDVVRGLVGLELRHPRAIEEFDPLPRG